MSIYRKISRTILGILILSTVLEFIFFRTEENLFGCLTFIIVWLLVPRYVLTEKKLEKCFLPTLAMTGLAFCFFFLPLVVTLVEGKPLTFRFQVPFSTFSLQLLNYLMLLGAFLLCTFTYREDNAIKRLWHSLGYFKPPTNKQIWVLGFIGVFCMISMLRIQGTDDAEIENLGTIGHIIALLQGYSVFPVALFFGFMYGSNNGYNDKKRVVLFVLFLMILAAATTKRTLIFAALTSVVTCYVVKQIIYLKRTVSSKSLIYLIIGFYLVTGPLSDIAMAMILNRHSIYDTSSKKTFSNVISLYNDKETLHNSYQLLLTEMDNKGNNDLGWSEYYVDNIFLDRFCNIRVCDATIYYAQKLGYNSNIMQQYFRNQMLFLLPTPILKALDIYINKFELQYTPGDLISTNGLGLKYQYFGYRVAGDVGIGLYLWGMMYFVYAFFFYYVLFYFLSTIVVNSPIRIIPIPVVVGLWGYINYFNNTTGLVRIVSTILRTGWQAIIVYCILFYIVRKIVK